MTAASAAARRISCAAEAPRARSRACSARRRAAPRGGHRRGQQGGQHGGGQTEEHEQHPGVGGVAAGGVQRGAEVVPDEGAAGVAGFEVVGRRGDRGVGGGGVGGQRVVQGGVDLGANQVGPGG